MGGGSNLGLNTVLDNWEFCFKGLLFYGTLSLARYCTSAIGISIPAEDNGVILEVLQGVSFFSHTVLVGYYSGLIMMFMKQEKVSSLLLWFYCVAERTG